MVRRVFIVRHGERVDHVDPNWYKTDSHPADPPLTPRGLEQAAEVGAYMMGLPESERPTKVFASPFFRTMQTASQIALKLDLPLNLEYGAMEWLNQDWFGEDRRLPEALLRATDETFPQLPVPVNTDHKPIIQPDGGPESREQIFNRCYKASTGIKETVADDVVVVVGHGISVEAMTIGFDPHAPIHHVTYCSITELVLKEDGKWNVTDLNCYTGHLSQPEKITHVQYK